ncbi:hypothetical protein [Listeria booriae]|nr:hypothetical protein [Listeria booriae]
MKDDDKMGVRGISGPNKGRIFDEEENVSDVDFEWDFVGDGGLWQ